MGTFNVIVESDADPKPGDEDIDFVELSDGERVLAFLLNCGDSLIPTMQSLQVIDSTEPAQAVQNIMNLSAEGHIEIKEQLVPVISITPAGRRHIRDADEA